MINRVQVGSPAVMKAVEPPKSIELGKSWFKFLLNKR